MAILIEKPARIEAEGNKIIEEFIGRVNSGTSEISIAKMISPGGWSEPAQTPEFDEYTLVLRGTLLVKTAAKEFTVNGGQAFIARRGEKVQYSAPDNDGAEYIAVCLPAFSPELVHRD